MSLRLTIGLISCILLSACATVNLDEMAAQAKASPSSALDINVVQRAATKLYAAFTSRGLVAKNSQKRMQSAARILLNGLEQKEVTTQDVSYASQASDPVIVFADIRTASRHVEQTTKAAEVYLAIAPVEKSLKKELGSLEEALLASRAAETIFEETLENLGQGLTASEFVNYSSLVDELKDVTNAFGDRVRDDYFRKPLAIN